MFKINSLSFFCAVIFAVSTLSPVFADDRPDPDYPQSSSTFEKRLLLDGKNPHPNSWEDKHFNPESWNKFRGSEVEMVGDLYDSGIIIDQTEENGVPVLEVGEAFLTLSSHDKLKVAQYIDHVYGVTSQENGTILINDYKTDRALGVYTRHGLQLQ